jgi:hypothetical protein
MAYPWRKWRRPLQPIHSCTILPILCDLSVVSLHLHIEVLGLEAPAPVFPCQGENTLKKSPHRRRRWKEWEISGKLWRCRTEIFGLVVWMDLDGIEEPETELSWLDEFVGIGPCCSLTNHHASVRLRHFGPCANLAVSPNRVSRSAIHRNSEPTAQFFHPVHQCQKCRDWSS